MQLYDKAFDAPKRYATLEKDRWALDGTFDIFPGQSADLIDDVGFMVTAYAMGMGFSPPLHGCNLILAMFPFCKPVLFGFLLTRLMGMQLILPSRLSKAGQLISARLLLATGLFPLALTDSRFITRRNPLTGYKRSIPFRRLGRLKFVPPGIYEKQWTNNDILASLDISQEVNFFLFVFAIWHLYFKHGQPFKAIRAEKQERLIPINRRRQGHSPLAWR